MSKSRVILRRAAALLSLAASPTFAAMAAAEALGRGSSKFLCTGLGAASPLDGMAVMYMLMSAFHSTSWLRLFSQRQRPGDGLAGTGVAVDAVGPKAASGAVRMG
ncbi:MAG: hypothetical protein JO303_17765 [Caulobacteraceae bacterium]|nr:hypothetical protein [Caulobacteraceae bacterium]